MALAALRHRVSGPQLISSHSTFHNPGQRHVLAPPEAKLRNPRYPQKSFFSHVDNLVAVEHAASVNTINLMAAKSNKKSPRKIPAKKVPKKGTQKAKKFVPSLPISPASDVEVVADAPNSIAPEVLKKILAVEKLVGKMGSMTDEEIVDEICDFVAEAAEYSRMSIQFGSCALVAAWGGGTFLNAQKKKLGRGAFGEWRKENFVDAGLSERSSRRYMKLASSCRDVRAIIESGASLRQAYIACGALQEPASTDQSGGAKAKPLLILTTGLRNVQKHMRLFGDALDGFEESKEMLSPEDKMELHLMKDVIRKFTQRILKLLP